MTTSTTANIVGSLTNGQVPVWNSTNQQFEPGAGGGGTPTTLAGLAGVATVSAPKTIVTGDSQVQPFTNITHFTTGGGDTSQHAIDSYVVPTGNGVHIVALLQGISKTNSTVNDYAFWKIECKAFNASGSTVFIGTTPLNVVTSDSTAGANLWLATIDLTTANTPTVRATGTGITNPTTITWTLVLQVTPMVHT